MKVSSFIEMLEPHNYKEADLTIYQQLLGKLMYLACKTRPDITFIFRRLSKHNVDLCKSHFRAAKRVVQYLKETMQLELVYDQQPDRSSTSDLLPYDLIGYGDSNFAGDLKDKKLVMGYCFFLNRRVVSWYDKKQKTVSNSTTEAKYIIISHAARKGI